MPVSPTPYIDKRLPSFFEGKVCRTRMSRASRISVDLDLSERTEQPIKTLEIALARDRSVKTRQPVMLSGE